MKEPVVRIKFKRLCGDAIIPKYMTSRAAGFDLSCIGRVVIGPQRTECVGTGLAVEMEWLMHQPGCFAPIGVCYQHKAIEMQIRPRSGLAVSKDYIVKNSPGTIDEDYRGEICVIIYNPGQFDLIFDKGDRIAQGVINIVERPIIEVVDSLSETERGKGGFGHTG